MRVKAGFSKPPKQELAARGRRHARLRLKFGLPRPICWLLAARLRRFLEDDLPRELGVAARHIEALAS